MKNFIVLSITLVLLFGSCKNSFINGTQYPRAKASKIKCPAISSNDKSIPTHNNKTDTIECRSNTLSHDVRTRVGEKIQATPPIAHKLIRQDYSPDKILIGTIPADTVET